MKKLFLLAVQNSLFRYLLVGVVNTIFSYSIIFGLTFLGVMVELSNTIGTILGVLCSYFLNKKFTFNKNQNLDSQNAHFRKFISAMFLAFVANMAVLSFLYRICGVNEYVSLIFAGAVYVVVGYLLNKFWVFK